MEFARNTVLVAHNARFDVSFLNAALERTERPRLDQRILDTAALARKILGGEVPNHKLETLVRHLRCAHQPTHRAYADALATVDVLHCLIERVAGFGVTSLEDLTAVSASRLDGTFSKIAMAADVPRGVGVYRFLGADGSTLYVGKATDCRSRVRSYFYGDARRRMRDLLREVQSISVETHDTVFEAEVAEARAIERELPPYNRAGKRRAGWYLKVAIRARTPKLAAARVPKNDGNLYLGPFESMKVVSALLAGLQDAFRIHRCTDPARCGGCAFAELGACAGGRGGRPREEVLLAAVALTCDPHLALDRLRARMTRCARTERYEEAAELRHRAALLERAIDRSVEMRALLDAREIVLAVGERGVLVRDGQLAAATSLDPAAPGAAVARLRRMARSRSVGDFVPAEVAREARAILRWIARHPDDVRLVAVEGSWALPARARPGPSFEPSSRVADPYPAGPRRRANASA
jgi:DNA polymerase-3 subunit epsilon